MNLKLQYLIIKRLLWYTNLITFCCSKKGTLRRINVVSVLTELHTKFWLDLIITFNSLITI